VWRNDLCVAFMSINPLRDGHVLVVPRAEIDHWLDCPSDLRDDLMEVSQTIGRAIQKVHDPARVGLMIAGLEVPHLHIHVVPIDGIHDLDFANAAVSVDRDHLEEQAEAIRNALMTMGVDGVAG